MSLDVYVETKCEHCGVTTRHCEFNYTYNLGQLWRDALAAVGAVAPSDGGGGAGEAFGPNVGLGFGAWLEKMGDAGPAGGLVPTLDAMLAWMATQELERYDSDNGWGDGLGGMQFVEDIRDCCRANPKARVSVWR